MQTGKLKIINAALITPFRRLTDACLVCENGKIACVGKEAPAAGKCREIDAKGMYVAPGFIDIHTHGGGGHDFMDGAAGAFTGAAQKHAEHGTTALAPTTLASSPEELINAFEAFKEAKAREYDGADMLGLHLEGPYFSAAQKGAQDPRYLRNPVPEEYLRILGLSGDIIRWSAAPELPGGMEFGRILRGRGILAAIAHSDAVSSEVDEAFESGYTHVTHLYSAMSGVRRINAFRFGGVIESAFLNDGLTVEIIADGVHLPPELLKLVYKIKGPSRTALVTDSMRAAGMPEGESILGSLKDGQRVIVEDGVAKLPDRSAFASSVATADRLVRNMVRLADVPLADAVRMMTATPAAIIGAGGRKGALMPGMDADVVIFDENVDVKYTIVRGKVVFAK
ncbi:MAG: N-acetylglucosamine-6-phosphate deacetylase [Firmicutes bacterium]|nr:N-acetylglucosamine-6-phosphate deacetylase [Bacillota bacterium]